MELTQQEKEAIATYLQVKVENLTQAEMEMIQELGL